MCVHKIKIPKKHLIMPRKTSPVHGSLRWMLLHSMFAVTQKYHLLLLFPLWGIFIFELSVGRVIGGFLSRGNSFFPRAPQKEPPGGFLSLVRAERPSVPCGPWVTKIVSAIELTSFGERRPVFKKCSSDCYVILALGKLKSNCVTHEQTERTQGGAMCSFYF